MDLVPALSGLQHRNVARLLVLFRDLLTAELAHPLLGFLLYVLEVSLGPLALFGFHEVDQVHLIFLYRLLLRILLGLLHRYIRRSISLDVVEIEVVVLLLLLFDYLRSGWRSLNGISLRKQGHKQIDVGRVSFLVTGLVASLASWAVDNHLRKVVNEVGVALVVHRLAHLAVLLDIFEFAELLGATADESSH